MIDPSRDRAAVFVCPLPHPLGRSKPPLRVAVRVAGPSHCKVAPARGAFPTWMLELYADPLGEVWVPVDCLFPGQQAADAAYAAQLDRQLSQYAPHVEMLSVERARLRMAAPAAAS